MYGQPWKKDYMSIGQLHHEDRRDRVHGDLEEGNRGLGMRVRRTTFQLKYIKFGQDNGQGRLTVNPRGRYTQRAPF